MRWLLIVLLVLFAGAAVYSWLGPAKKAEQKRAQPIRLSDMEDRSVLIQSLPSVQMHLIPRTQPTPLSPVTDWGKMNREKPTTPINH